MNVRVKRSYIAIDLVIFSVVVLLWGSTFVAVKQCLID